MQSSEKHFVYPWSPRKDIKSIVHFFLLIFIKAALFTLACSLLLLFLSHIAMTAHYHCQLSICTTAFCSWHNHLSRHPAAGRAQNTHIITVLYSSTHGQKLLWVLAAIFYSSSKITSPQPAHRIQTLGFPATWTEEIIWPHLVQHSGDDQFLNGGIGHKRVI